ncbi:MAG: pteridine reductase, partial [Kiritimatiellia bacterium]
CVEVGGGGVVAQGDLSDAAQTLRVAAEVANQVDGLDILVNNASLYEPSPIDEVTLQAWRRMQAVNVEAPMLLSQALLPKLRRRGAERVGSGSLIVHMCDIAADRPFRGYAHYCASKAALVSLVKSMAVELAPVIRCVGIAPGHVAWPPNYDESTRKRMLQRIPQQRVGTPEEVGRLVRFLWEQGTYINGDVIRVDGGLASRY